MNHKNKKNTPLISSAISLLLMTTSTASFAEAGQEQCAGIVKAGLNDCASVEHACAGMNTDDGYESDWVWLPTGTCNKITGARIINKKIIK